MSAGALPLLARLAEAATFPKAVRAYESDPWSYLRRKLGECEDPLRAYKRTLYDEACAALLRDLQDSFLKPGAVLDHKETFEKLLTPADFADLSFNLAPGGDPAARREVIAAVLAAARPKTLFDVEKLPRSGAASPGSRSSRRPPGACGWTSSRPCSSGARTANGAGPTSCGAPGATSGSSYRSRAARKACATTSPCSC
ncbi:MAG: hypothetical protein M0D55_00455 [Elusimicrobiota bacterium]|nr:MAG: hypothetical protein M0D55_00455 [Elusimicrobiota bacterium]